MSEGHTVSGSSWFERSVFPTEAMLTSGLTVAEGHVWVYGPTSASVRVAIQSLCYYQRRRELPGSALPTEAMLMCEGCAEMVLYLPGPGSAH